MSFLIFFFFKLGFMTGGKQTILNAFVVSGNNEPVLLVNSGTSLTGASC